MGILPNKIENHKHYRLALRLGYKDAKASARTHEHRYDTYEYQMGYWDAMHRWNNVERVIDDFYLKYATTHDPDIRSHFESRRKFRQRRRRNKT